MAARAKLQAVPLGVCKVEDHPRGCHSVGYLACAWELCALPNKEAKMAAVRLLTLTLSCQNERVSKLRIWSWNTHSRRHLAPAPHSYLGSTRATVR